MKKKISVSGIIIHIVIGLLSAVCLLPMILAFITSFADEAAIRKNGYSFFPDKWSLNAYKYVFRGGSDLLRGYGITIFVTVVGTLIATLITMGAAYALANKRMKFRNFFAVYFFITMIFNAGMVPWFLICCSIGLSNNLLALIIPSLMFSPYNLFLTRNYMSGIPDSLRESAMLDGANDIQIFARVYVPLSKPVAATIVLFYGLAYWNDWWNAIMLVENKMLYPLQYAMLLIKSQTNMANEMSSILGSAVDVLAPTESVKMATAMLTIGPIVLFYPYLQKYFVKGLIIGSVKG